MRGHSHHQGAKGELNIHTGGEAREEEEEEEEEGGGMPMNDLTVANKEIICECKIQYNWPVCLG